MRDTYACGATVIRQVVMVQSKRKGAVDDAMRREERDVQDVNETK